MGGIQSFSDEIALVPSQPFSLPAFLPKMTSTSMKMYITLVGKLLLDLLLDLQWALAGTSQTHLGFH